MISFLKRLFSKKEKQSLLRRYPSEVYPEIHKWFLRHEYEKECIKNMHYKVIVRSHFECGYDAARWFYDTVIPWLEENMEYTHNFNGMSYGHINEKGDGWHCNFVCDYSWFECLTPLTVQFEFSFSDLQTATHFRLRF